MRSFFRQLALCVIIVIHTFSLGMLWFMNRQPLAHVAAQPVIAAQPDIVQAVQAVPIRVIVPSLALSVDVIPGEYNARTDSWTLSGYKAQYATMTVPANNQQGNTFIYGHNNMHVFGKLKYLKTGDQVIVIGSNGNQFTYALESSRVVVPEDVSLFAYQGAPILTIQTCTGVWHEKRNLLQFRLVGYVESNAELSARQEQRRQALVDAISQPLQGYHGILPAPALPQ